MVKHVLDVASVVVLVSLVLLASTRVRQGWHALPVEHAPPYWPWSDTSYSLVARAVMPALAVGWAFVALIPWFFGLAGMSGTWGYVFLAPCAVVIVSFALLVSIALVNAPKWAVPPALRNERGVISRRRRRSTVSGRRGGA